MIIHEEKEREALLRLAMQKGYENHRVLDIPFLQHELTVGLEKAMTILEELKNRELVSAPEEGEKEWHIIPARAVWEAQILAEDAKGKAPAESDDSGDELTKGLGDGDEEGGDPVVYVLLAEGFEEIEALMPVDILRRAGLPVFTVGMTKKEVTGAHGVHVTADLTADEANDRIGLLILPGGMPGAKNLDESPFTNYFISRAQTDHGRLAAICAAPMVLGKRGLLYGLRATCYPGFEQYLRGAAYEADRRVVTDDNITTAAGMGVATEFAMELVRLVCGKRAAAKLAEDAIFPPAEN